MLLNMGQLFLFYDSTKIDPPLNLPIFGFAIGAYPHNALVIVPGARQEKTRELPAAAVFTRA